MSLVKWTLDPLQARNAFFNIVKLGAVCRAYVRNLYGSLDDSLNRGRMTDRFEVEWWVRSKRVKQAIRPGSRRPVLSDLLVGGVEVVNLTRMMRDVRKPSRTRLRLDGRKVAC